MFECESTNALPQTSPLTPDWAYLLVKQAGVELSKILFVNDLCARLHFPDCFADTVYFHLPPLGGDRNCVYGVSCYRQIEAKVGRSSISIIWICPRRSSVHVCVLLIRLQALKVRQADVTRETVQKSVCVLSRVVSRSSLFVFKAGFSTDGDSHPSAASFVLQPLYGLLQAKLQLITHAYFEEKDFSQISILKVRIGVGVPFFFFPGLHR